MNVIAASVLSYVVSPTLTPAKMPSVSLVSLNCASSEGVPPPTKVLSIEILLISSVIVIVPSAASTVPPVVVALSRVTLPSASTVNVNSETTV